MPSSVSLGTPLFTDGSTYSGLLLRQLWCATKTFDKGTTTAVSPSGGVFPGGGQLAITAPGSGMSVNVAAGYCCIPHTTAGHGAYLLGLMASGSLTVATADATNPRIDLICANVQDTGSGAFGQVEILTGTPTSGATLSNLTGAPSLPATTTSSSIAIAYLLVPATATNIVSGDIGDHRVYAAPPGCVPQIANAAAAPAVPATQMMYDVATTQIVQGTGTAGSVGSMGFTEVGGMSIVNTSAGAQGITPGSPAGDPWGIGYGEIGHTGKGASNTDGTLATEMQVTFTADGTSDYEIFFKWQLAIPAQAFNGGTQTLTGCGVTLYVLLDGVHVDEIDLLCASSPLTTSGGGSASWFTSAGQGNTPSAGHHTATLAIETSSSFSATGPVCGVLMGDVHASGGTIFGAGGGYLAALTAEQCLIRVMQVPVG